MNNQQIVRMEQINQLLNEISKYDRHFFAKERFAMNAKGNLRYICNDGYEVMPKPSKNGSSGFLHGSTLNQLLNKMKIYILTGRKSNRLNTRSWGYATENVEHLQSYAQDIGFLLREDEPDKAILKACRKLNINPNEIFRLENMDGRYVIFNNDPKYGSGLYYLWKNKDEIETCTMTLNDLFKEIKQGRTKVIRSSKYTFDLSKKEELFSYMIENFRFENAVSRLLLSNIIQTVGEVENSGNLLCLLLDGIGVTEEELLKQGFIKINYINS